MFVFVQAVALTLALRQGSSDLEFSVSPQQGLTVTSKGFPIVRGSGFQYYAPGWTKGYYSSHWKDQSVRKVDENTYDLSFSSGPASGIAHFHREGNRIIVDYEFNWNISDPAQIEFNEGLIWAPPFRDGKVKLDDVTRTLPQLPPVGGLGKRILGKPATETTFSGPIIKVTVSSSEPMETYDGRRYEQDWAQAAPVYWLGLLDMPIHNGIPKKVHVEYKFETKDAVKANSKSLSIAPIPVKDAILPDESIPPLIPSPKMSFLDYKNVLVITNLWKLPAGRPKFFDFFKSELEKRFEMPTAGTSPDRVSFDGGMTEYKKRDGTYHIKITKDSISMYGQLGSQAGMRNAAYRLLNMAFIRDGKVCLPTGVLEDEPRSDFRGVHLFVGPNSLPFHQKLWTNVLRPLGFNEVVLQCERTDWKAFPSIHASNTMSQSELVNLFKWYRSIDVEPIPLIQSFGHMQWFFANGSNLEFAVNPRQPYAIDPRKPGAKEAIGKIWDEAIQTLKPKTIHFGLDEVDMIGFEKNDQELVTSMWKELLPYLGEIATRNNVKMMLWGDEGLAPGEAIDAMNGADSANAAARRKAIPKGSFVADWHYKAEQNHVPFLKSLQTWKGDDLNPIASTWYQPSNIRGFDIAADVENVGTLQTTWNGYESSEENMLKDLKQYSALIVAGDYGWSGRSEKVEELPYDPMAVLAKMFNPHQSPLVPSEGLLVGRGDVFSCGGIKFSLLTDTSLAGISPASFQGPDSVTVELGGVAKEVALALTCDVQSKDSAKVGSVELTYRDGTVEKIPLLYGLHVRAVSDDQATFFGIREKDRTCLRLPLQGKEVASIRILAEDRFSGLRLDGVTLIPVKGKKSPS